MSFELTDIELDEVSLVDRPANPLAKVVLFKMDSDAGTPPSEDPIDKKEGGLVADTQTPDSDLPARVEKLEQENAELRKSASQASFREKLPKGLQAVFDKLESDEEKDEFMTRYGKTEKAEDDPVAKALSETAKKAEDLAVKVAKMEQAEARRTFLAKHEDLSKVVDLDKLAEPLMKMCQADSETVIIQLRALAKQAETGELFKVAGQDGGVSEKSARAKVEKSLDEIQKANTAITREQAFARLADTNPKLVSELVSEEG